MSGHHVGPLTPDDEIELETVAVAILLA